MMTEFSEVCLESCCYCSRSTAFEHSRDRLARWLFCLVRDMLFTAILGAFNYKLFTNLGLLQTLPAETSDNQQHNVRLWDKNRISLTE